MLSTTGFDARYAPRPVSEADIAGLFRAALRFW